MQVVIMLMMLLGKLRGLPTHTDIITDFDFREVTSHTKTRDEMVRLHLGLSDGQPTGREWVVETRRP